MQPIYSIVYESSVISQFTSMQEMRSSLGQNGIAAATHRIAMSLLPYENCDPMQWKLSVAAAIAMQSSRIYVLKNEEASPELTRSLLAYVCEIVGMRGPRTHRRCLVGRLSRI